MDTSLASQQNISLHYDVSVNKNDVLPIVGQGTVSVCPKTIDNALTIVLSTPDGFPVGLTVEAHRVSLWMKTEHVVLKESDDADLCLHPLDVHLPYWLSLDSNNKRLRYGKGEMLNHLVLLDYSWADEGKEHPLNLHSKQIRNIRIEGVQIDHLKILQVPVTLDPSPILVPSSAVTMESIAANLYSVIDDLPAACRRLYANVAGPGMTLAPPDFPEFAQAIQHSIVTPGALCHEKLLEKVKETPEFGYLRVTLDANMGDSPGQPYVLEIWPAGNGSPIHDHGRACAVIKVLHGQIEVSWFKALNKSITKPWGSMVAHAGDVTFLTPDYYQIHKLRNPSPKEGGDFCATIQCYRYADDDSQHYEYFDYLDDDKIQRFDPDSDWKYLDFKEAIRQEWAAAAS
jgi:hypothetical protein